jgi:hypothetical protein
MVDQPTHSKHSTHHSTLWLGSNRSADLSLARKLASSRRTDRHNSARPLTSYCSIMLAPADDRRRTYLVGNYNYNPVLLGLLPAVASVLLLATGAYVQAHYGGNGTDKIVEDLLIATICLVGVAWLPVILAFGLDLRPLWPLAVIVVPAAVHLAFHIQGRTSAYWGCSIADLVCSLFALLGMGYMGRILAIF